MKDYNKHQYEEERVPHISVEDAWGEMNKLLDINMPISKAVTKPRLKLKGSATIIKVMLVTGCAAAIFTGYHFMGKKADSLTESSDAKIEMNEIFGKNQFDSIKDTIAKSIAAIQQDENLSLYNHSIPSPDIKEEMPLQSGIATSLSRSKAEEDKAADALKEVKRVENKIEKDSAQVINRAIPKQMPSVKEMVVESPTQSDARKKNTNQSANLVSAEQEIKEQGNNQSEKAVVPDEITEDATKEQHESTPIAAIELSEGLTQKELAPQNVSLPVGASEITKPIEPYDIKHVVGLSETELLTEPLADVRKYNALDAIESKNATIALSAQDQEVEKKNDAGDSELQRKEEEMVANEAMHNPADLEKEVSVKSPEADNQVQVKSSQEGRDSRYALGLQNSFKIPIGGADGYFRLSNGGNNPLMLLIPEFWISRRFATNHQLRLLVSPYSQILINDYRLNKTDTSAIDSSGITSIDRTIKKVSGWGVTLNYDYKVNSHWQISAAMGYHRLKRALIYESSSSSDSSTSVSGQYRGIKNDSLFNEYIKSNVLIGRVEVAYHLSRFIVGSGITIPVLPIAIPQKGRSFPLNWDIYIRYTLFRWDKKDER